MPTNSGAEKIFTTTGPIVSSVMRLVVRCCCVAALASDETGLDLVTRHLGHSICLQSDSIDVKNCLLRYQQPSTAAATTGLDLVTHLLGHPMFLRSDSMDANNSLYSDINNQQQLRLHGRAIYETAMAVASTKRRASRLAWILSVCDQREGKRPLS